MILTVDEIRRLITPIAETYDVKRLSLFGSYARGEADENSDVDLLIEKGDKLRGWAMGGLYNDLSNVLGKELDLVSTSINDPVFLASIKSDEVTLYES